MMTKAISLPMVECTKHTLLIYLQSEVIVLQILNDESCDLAFSLTLVVRWLDTIITMVTLFAAFLVGG